MKSKILNFLLILSSLFGYLEWGGGNSMFLFQGEWDVITKLFTDPRSVIHPLTLLPLIGQILLLITLFQKRPGMILSYLGLGGIAVLMILIFVIGIISTEFKIIVSTIPFLLTAIITIAHWRKKKALANQ